MQITEENFIEQMKKGNEKSLEYVIDNYAWIIKTVLKKHLFYLMDYYDECMNDCLLAIWENIYYYNPEKSSFKNWIGGIARFKAIDYTRKYLRDLEDIDIEDANVSIEDNSYKKVIERETKEDIRNLLKYLSKEDQVIFKKIYFEEKDINEVSSDMGLSKTILYNRISRGKKKIRDIAKKEGGSKNEGIKKYL